ncbi:MAG: hypothetical protein SOW48_00005, partial [Peptoniphilaceae bacterium]|nr:hypothetical protein [Peptoniphilaceae bacterium]MDY3075039.1 hypothetical protein [Peptoniphilaceae bacterium]
MSKENEDIKKDAPLDQSIGSSFIYQNKYNTISKKSQDRIDELIKIYTTQTINDFQKSLFPYEESELVSHSRIYGIYDVFDRHLAFSDSQAQAAFEHLIKFYRYFDLNKEHNKYLLNVTQYSDLLLYAVDFTFKSYCVSGVEWFPKDGNLNRSFYRGLANKVIENFNIMVGTLTAPLDQGGLNRFSRWPMLKELSPIQAAQIVFTCEIIRTVCTLENLHSPVANGIVAYYCRSGKNYGIYEKLGRGQVDTWAEWLSGAVKKNWKMEFYEKLIDLASRDENRIIENKNPDLVFMNNCIINVRSKERLPFSPDYVSLRKHAVMALDSLPDMPIWKLKNGKVLTAEDYIRGFVTYEGGRETLIKVIGAVLRAKFNWRHMITLHNVTGNNGKSTFLG